MSPHFLIHFLYIKSFLRNRHLFFRLMFWGKIGEEEWNNVYHIKLLQKNKDKFWLDVINLQECSYYKTGYILTFDWFTVTTKTTSLIKSFYLQFEKLKKEGICIWLSLYCSFFIVIMVRFVILFFMHTMLLV